MPFQMRYTRCELTSHNPFWYNDGKLHEIVHVIMRITELAKRFGVTTDQIRYLERKGYIDSTWTKLDKRRIRYYPEVEINKLELLIKYLDQGFRYDIAYQKTVAEMQNPRFM